MEVGGSEGLEGGITNECKETVGDDGYIYYPDGGEGFTGVNMC